MAITVTLDSTAVTCERARRIRPEADKAAGISRPLDIAKSI